LPPADSVARRQGDNFRGLLLLPLLVLRGMVMDGWMDGRGGERAVAGD